MALRLNPPQLVVELEDKWQLGSCLEKRWSDTSALNSEISVSIPTIVNLAASQLGTVPSL